MRIRRISFFILLCCLCWNVFAAEYQIKGVVIDKSTRQPLEFVNVLVVGLGIGASTDANGNFLITQVPPGIYRLQASFLGYKTELTPEYRVNHVTPYVQIELEEERRFLRFYAEYNLTRKPLQIDVLVVRKETGRVIQKNIGRIFRQYNVVEYKGIKDYISINDFYKSIGYACLLQSNTERVQEILPSQVTVTLAGEHYPRSLHVFLEKAYGVHMEEEAPGIYYIKGLLFPLQILVIRELSKEDNIWLSRLRSGLKPDEDIEVLMKEYKGKEQNPLYETAMDLILRANWETCQEVEKMCDALRELFADELEERETIGLEKGLEQGKMAKLITQVMRKREKGQSASRIAEDLMEPADVVQRLYDLIGLHPDSDAEHILAYMESWDKV